MDLPCKYFFNNITEAFLFVIGKCGKLFDDDLLLNMINKTLAFFFAQSHVLILRAAIWVSIIIIIIIMITIRTLINSPQKNVPNYNWQLDKTEKAPINKAAFKTSSLNLRKYIGVTTIPMKPCFTGWEEIC